MEKAVALAGRTVKAVRHAVTQELGRKVDVVLVFDNDAEGQRAARELAESLGDRARLLRLPDGIKDLGELGASSDGRETFFSLMAERWPADKEVRNAPEL